MSSDIKSTTNYSQFKFLEANRDPLPNRVEELKRSIKQKNKLSTNPIIVDKYYHVIDGQHRLFAARELKIPIYYVIDDDSDESDIILLNTTRTNWSIPDYIYYYYDKNLEEYKFLQELIELSSKYYIPFTGIFASLPYLMGSENRNLTKSIREGKFKVKNKELVKSFIEKTFPLCKEINKKIKVPKNKVSSNLFFKRCYLQTLTLCFKYLTEKQYDDLWKCLNRDYLSFTDTTSMFEVQKLFEHSFNFGRRTQILNFDVLKKNFEMGK